MTETIIQAALKIAAMFVFGFFVVYLLGKIANKSKTIKEKLDKYEAMGRTYVKEKK